MLKIKLIKIIFILFSLTIVLSTCSATLPQNEIPFTETPVPQVTQTVFLPVISKPTDPKFFGIYFKKYWNKDEVKDYLPLVDQGAEKKHTAIGWFIDLEDVAFTGQVTYLPGNPFFEQLEALWQGGYVSFVNLGSNATATDINNGGRDNQIRYAAEVYKEWISLGNGRKAMIAPLQEMNGTWTAYGEKSTSEEYKQAYKRIFDIFSNNGISRDQIWWVFAPNGWNDPTKPERAFENYYPGDAFVDIVGFSSYNYGWCPSTADISGKWESYAEIFDPYIDRMMVLASTKPIIVAETATSAYASEGIKDIYQKNNWLIENYNYLANHPEIIGVFYFSFSDFDGYACDFEINTGDLVFSGYRDGISNPAYQYITINQLNEIIK